MTINLVIQMSYLQHPYRCPVFFLQHLPSTSIAAALKAAVSTVLHLAWNRLVNVPTRTNLSHRTEGICRDLRPTICVRTHRQYNCTTQHSPAGCRLRSFYSAFQQPVSRIKEPPFALRSVPIASFLVVRNIGSLRILRFPSKFELLSTISLYVTTLFEVEALIT